MKKIFWALTFAALLPWSIAAQDARQRTIATIIADALDQLPAAKQQDYNNIMNELMSTGTAGIVLLGEMLVPADKGKNASIEHALYGVVSYVTAPDKAYIKDEAFIKKFKAHSAAKTVHHGFSGGLLEHTLSVTRMCDYFATSYSILNRDLLLSSAILHDIGKVKELSDFPDNDYTDEGQLIGHIVIGVEMIDDAIRSISDFPVKLAHELKHCIVAHHGELEYGSPKKPALAEAVALNMADSTDAKLQTLTELFKGKTGTEWLGYNRLFESNLRRASED